MSFANKQGLRFDAMHNPIGGRIQETPTPGKKYQKLKNSTYMSEASIAKCTSCKRGSCNGRCDEILELERGVVDPRKNRRRRSRNAMAQSEGRKYEYRGEMRTAKDLAAIAGISRPAFYDRIKRGWSVEEAAETPARGNRPRKE